MVKSLVRGNRDLIKAMNRNLLLNTLRREGQLSRTQLTEISGLSVGAVSQSINDLLEKNWLLETGEIESTGGRRQTDEAFSAARLVRDVVVETDDLPLVLDLVRQGVGTALIPWTS